MDSDDRLRPGALARMLAAFDAHTSAVCAPPFLIRPDGSPCSRPIPPPPRVPMESLRRHVLSCLSPDHLGIPTGGCFVYRRSAIALLFPLEWQGAHLGPDMALRPCAMLHGTVRYLGEPIIDYRQRWDPNNPTLSFAVQPKTIASCIGRVRIYQTGFQHIERAIERLGLRRSNRLPWPALHFHHASCCFYLLKNRAVPADIRLPALPALWTMLMCSLWCFSGRSLAARLAWTVLLSTAALLPGRLGASYLNFIEDWVSNRRLRRMAGPPGD